MALMTSDAKLFGVDLSSLGRQLHDAWQQLLDLPLLRRGMPATRMQVVGAETDAWVRGSRLSWHMSARADGHKSPAAYSAILVGSDQVLARTLLLPSMPSKALHGAVELDVYTMSPFSQEQTLWAYAARGAEAGTGQKVDVVITSRDLVEQAIAVHGFQGADNARPEVWLQAPAGPIMLPGFGEQRRLKREARQRVWLLLGGVAVVGLVAALAITPTAQLRLRAIDAASQLTKLAKGTSEVAARRQTMMAEAESVAELLKLQQQQLDHLRLLAMLTQLLPDDTAVQRIQFKGTKLIVNGLSDNASAVVSTLAKEPGFREVRLPSAVTRVSRTSKESFVLEAMIDPAILGLHAVAPKEPEQAPEAQAPSATKDSAKEGA